MQLQQPKLPSAIRVGSEVELRCHVDGSGDMTYEWFKLVLELCLFTYLRVSRDNAAGARS